MRDDARAATPDDASTASRFTEASTTTVRVHVYDLNANYNDLAYPIGLGIHHSAVEIYDREYAFGYHDDANVTGVFDIAPKSAPHPAKYRETIEIGTSLLTEDQFADALEALRRDFPGPSYDLLKTELQHVHGDDGQSFDGEERSGIRESIGEFRGGGARLRAVSVTDEHRRRFADASGDDGTGRRDGGRRRRGRGAVVGGADGGNARELIAVVCSEVFV